MKPQILFACKIADLDARKRMESHAEILELDTCSEQVLLENVVGKTALIVPITSEVVVTKKVIDNGCDLKIVGTTYGGTRQSIEDLYAIKKGLHVIHTGPVRPRPMAEYTLGLTLCSLMEIHNYHHYMNSGEDWPRHRFPRSRILHNRKVGIIGFGMIGKAIYDIFSMFTSNIMIRSSHMSDTEASELKIVRAELNEIFSQCEIIILSGGHTGETTHMIGREQFELMRERALFVNIARGKIVDEKAMAEIALKKNIQLALDVFEKEPLSADSPLRRNDRVLLTPHRANNPIEFELRWQFLADEFDRYFKGERPQTSLTIERASVMSES